MKPHSSDIEKKIEELNAKIKALQGGLEDDVKTMKQRVGGMLDPKDYIKKHPLSALSAAVILGFLVASSGKKKVSIQQKSSENGIGSLFLNEIKRTLMRKGLQLLTSKMEEGIYKSHKNREIEKE